MKIIHCTLWGDIELSDLAISIIDTPHFQRLHYIKQTGMSYKVFPGAHTTRFEHSLGVYNITQTLLRHLLNNQPELILQCDKRKQELICIAGLIHDLGHGPYSHLFDAYLKKKGIKNSWLHHENRSIELFRNIISTYNIDILPEEIIFIKDLIMGNEESLDWYYHIINNKVSGLDMDKMDYVLRDSMHFGMKIFFDPLRIIKNSKVIDNELCFCERVKDEIMTVFLIRNKMNRFIYRHPKICKYENTIIELLDSEQLSQKIIDIISEKNINEFIQLNDYSLLFRIPFNIWMPYECRKIKMENDINLFKDKEWKKIKKIKFYNKKLPDQKFLIDDWTIISCF